MTQQVTDSLTSALHSLIDEILSKKLASLYADQSYNTDSGCLLELASQGVETDNQGIVALEEDKGHTTADIERLIKSNIGDLRTKIGFAPFTYVTLAKYLTRYTELTPFDKAYYSNGKTNFDNTVYLTIRPGSKFPIDRIPTSQSSTFCFDLSATKNAFRRRFTLTSSNETRVRAAGYHSRTVIKSILEEQSTILLLIDIFCDNEITISALTYLLSLNLSLTTQDRELYPRRNITYFQEQVKSVMGDKQWLNNPFHRVRTGAYALKEELPILIGTSLSAEVATRSSQSTYHLQGAYHKAPDIRQLFMHNIKYIAKEFGNAKFHFTDMIDFLILCAELTDEDKLPGLTRASETRFYERARSAITPSHWSESPLLKSKGRGMYCLRPEIIATYTQDKELS